MTSIPIAICRIYGTNFKRHDLENKRFFLDMQNLWHQFQTSCRKQKIFFDFLLYFWNVKCAWNLENFRKKDEYSSLIISEIIDAERRGYLNV